MKAIGLLCNELSGSLVEQIAKYMLLLDIILIRIIFVQGLTYKEGTMSYKSESSLQCMGSHDHLAIFILFYQYVVMNKNNCHLGVTAQVLSALNVNG